MSEPRPDFPLWTQPYAARIRDALDRARPEEVLVVSRDGAGGARIGLHTFGELHVTLRVELERVGLTSPRPGEARTLVLQDGDEPPIALDVVPDAARARA
jgi:hypothetical protein